MLFQLASFASFVLFCPPCSRYMPQVSFFQTNFSSGLEAYTSLHSIFLLTPLSAQCKAMKASTKMLKTKVSMTKVWLLKDLHAQPIKFYHNRSSICIEKISISLAVDMRATLPSQRIEQIWRKCRHVFTKAHYARFSCYDPVLEMRGLWLTHTYKLSWQRYKCYCNFFLLSSTSPLALFLLLSFL